MGFATHIYIKAVRAAHIPASLSGWFSILNASALNSVLMRCTPGFVKRFIELCPSDTADDAAARVSEKAI
jgi:hypothetical protein